MNIAQTILRMFWELNRVLPRRHSRTGKKKKRNILSRQMPWKEMQVYPYLWSTPVQKFQELSDKPVFQKMAMDYILLIFQTLSQTQEAIIDESLQLQKIRMKDCAPKCSRSKIHTLLSPSVTSGFVIAIYYFYTITQDKLVDKEVRQE